jgi:hypothetical protein
MSSLRLKQNLIIRPLTYRQRQAARTVILMTNARVYTQKRERELKKQAKRRKRLERRQQKRIKGTVHMVERRSSKSPPE